MTKESFYLGKKGEEAAFKFLRKIGYKIIARNYKVKIGEVDIIAIENDTVCFIEVKTRHSDKYGLASEAVGFRKQQKIQKAALCFLKEKKFFDKKARFDVVTITGSRSPELIKNAFELDQRYTC